MNLNKLEIAKEIENFKVPVLPMTKDFLEEQRLGYYGGRTGWRCGDYVAYRALAEDWDSAWIVEPDVAFLNGSERIFEDFEAISADLVCSQFRDTVEDWWWRKGMLDLMPELSVFGMEFPILRISRRLVLTSLDLRRKLDGRLAPKIQIPNDEAVVASAA